MAKNNYLHESQGKIYDSYEMQDPRGNKMFLCDEKKIKWYLKKNLVEKVDDQTYKLKFEPKGQGNTNPFFLEKLPNICVVCGYDKELSKHHVVPYQYRKVLPDEYKNSNHFDVLCVCLDCHEEYEEKANKFKDKLHKHFDISMNSKVHSNKHETAVNCILIALKENIATLPDQSIDRLLENLSKHLGKEYTIEQALAMDLFEVPKDNFYEKRDSILMERYLKVGHTYEDFILMWRQHFLDTMEPECLSQNWLDHYTTFFKKPQ